MFDNILGTDITPVSGSDLYFGFGGVAVDLQKPGTIMVAALNSWWPDGQIFRSNDSGTTWSPLWSWESYPTINKFYTYSDSLAPWIGPNYVDTTLGVTQIGWMMECKFNVFLQIWFSGQLIFFSLGN
jgi:xyloglucan-specific exo-beta-1,4-glucanase